MSVIGPESMSLSELERVLSSARLAPYRQRSTSDQEAVCLYLWNLALSRELYPIINGVEVALRNTIHQAATTQFGAADWFRNARILRHDRRQWKMVEDAQYSLWGEQGFSVRDIKDKVIAAPAPSPVDDHLAKLTFGFWTGIMNAPYELKIWNPIAVDLSPLAFPYAGRADQQRAIIFPMVDQLRKLRNRVSHNEPILWWQPSLQAEYQSACVVLGWISPALAQLVLCIDGFDTVFRSGHMHYLAQVTLTT